MPILEHTGRHLAVEPGEVLAVLGAPASGKSALALELAFLRRPEAGEVLFHGSNPMARHHPLEMLQRPRQVALLVQNAEDQLFAKTVYDDVAFGPRHLTLDEDEIEKRVLGALEAVRLDPASVRQRSPFALSGGERRRVALAGVLAMEPEVLILDEPTANLDPRTRSEFLDLLAPLRGKSAIIWLTSSAQEASLASRIYLLRDGTLSQIGGGGELLRSWRVLAASGVELPSLFELAEELQRRGMPLPDTGSREEMRDAIVRQWQEKACDR